MISLSDRINKGIIINSAESMSLGLDMEQSVSNYINAIQNEIQKSFAQNYFDWKKSGVGLEPSATGLGLVIAQKIRAQIQIIMKSWEE